MNKPSGTTLTSKLSTWQAVLSLSIITLSMSGLFMYLVWSMESVEIVSSKPTPMVLGDRIQYPPTYQDHRDYRCNGTCATGNLVTEDGSFETGIGDTLDTISFYRRMPYDAYFPGTGNILSSNPAIGYVKPEITTSDFVDGSRSLKIINTHQDGLLFDLNWIRPTQSGKHVFSVYAKATNLPVGVDRVLCNLTIYDKDWNRVTDPATDRWLYAGDWNRLSIPTYDLTAGLFYHVIFRIGSAVIPNTNGTFYVDAFQFEYAANQSNPQPGTYVYPTTKQELFAYTSTDSNGAVPKTGNVYFLEDAETINSQIQIYEEANIPVDGAQLKWWLYDSYGDSNTPATALDSGNIAINHSSGSLQTQHQNISQILASSAPTKTKGVYKMVYELWNAGDTEMIDKEFLVFGIFENSPYYGQDRPDSFFGNHVSLSLRYNDWSYFAERRYQGFQANRPVDEYLDLAERLGIKISREFGLLQQDLVENQQAWGVADPFFDDYVNGARAHHISLLPVIGQRSGNYAADDRWQTYAQNVAEHYEQAITAYEVLNEPVENNMPYDRYYGYLWRAREEFQAVNPNVAIVGPSSNLTYFNNLLTHTDSIHGLGYDLFTSFAHHTYFQYADGMRTIPEDGQGAYDDVDDYYNQWDAIADAASPSGNNVKTNWDTETGINQSRLYDDIPQLSQVVWTGPDAIFYPHMSGSISLNRKLASDLIRYKLYQLANHTEKFFQFGLFNNVITDGDLYAMFDYDNTPMIAAAAYSETARLLDGATYVRRIESGELKTNGVLDSESRAFVFSAPDPEHPNQTRPIVVAFNWNQSQTGAELANVAINTSDLALHDMEGNLISPVGDTFFSLPIDMSPKYLIGKNGLTVSEMVLALDTIRPASPFRPSASDHGSDILISWMSVPSADVETYKIYRRVSGSTDESYVGTIAKADAPLQTYYDAPGTGLWEYRVSAVESGSGYEASSPYSLPASSNLAPSIIPIGNKTIHERDVLSFIVTATDTDAGDQLTITADPLPSGATFTDHGDRTATFNWTPSDIQANEYSITFTASDGTDTVAETITITVLDGTSNCTPNWQCTDWSMCSDSLQTRICTDLHECGTDAGRPVETASCDSTPPGTVLDLR